MKAKIIFILIILCLSVLAGCKEDITSLSDDEKRDRVETYYEDTGDFQATKDLIKELYPDDSSKQLELSKSILLSINSGILVDNVEEYGVDALEIQDGWKWTTDGDYAYVTGRVKNIGNTPIEYFEITAEYCDASGQVLDSDYTNSGQTINPGDMKEFEIMHEHSDEYKKVKIYVNEAN